MFWYRGPGVVATIALASYVLITLAIFLLVPVTLTAAGLAGLVLSLGMAVDANVLVFERMKEEYRSGKSSRQSILDGFDRAWSAIRDGNVTALLSAIILFWFGNSLIKGFALVLGIGTIISIVSAITITRTLLMVLPDVKREDGGLWPWLFWRLTRVIEDIGKRLQVARYCHREADLTNAGFHIWLFFDDPLTQAQAHSHAVGQAPELGRLVPFGSADPDSALE